MKADEQEKKKSRPTQITSKKRPRKINMPSDYIDRRSHPAYRAGPITTYNLHGGDTVALDAKLSLDELPDWRQFKRMEDEEKQRELLMVYCRKYTDLEISNAMQGPEYGFRHYRAKLGILRKDPLNPEKYEDREVVVIKNPKRDKNGQVALKEGEELQNKNPRTEVAAIASGQPALQDGMRFSIRGTYAPSELQKKFLALAGVFEEGLFDGTNYSVHVAVVEDDGEPVEEKGR